MATGLFNLKQVNQAISQGAWSGYIAPKWVEYLVVAGGGGGGYESNGGAGGGGGGGLLTGIVTVAAGTSYTVTVGAGGATSTSNTVVASNGAASVFGSISAAGGGGGGARVNGASGGSGGGGGDGTNSTSWAPGQGVSGQGNAGGRVTLSYQSAPGGGGAGTVGLSSVLSNTIGANGGAGIASSISGTVTTYAGGGGGGSGALGGCTAGTGGVGGGGNSGYNNGSTNFSPNAGGGNTGGGGGGTGNYTGYGAVAGAAGGSGIVVVRYPGNVQFFTGGTLSYANGYMIHTFYASGTLAPTTPTPYVTSYQISRSLRFNSADSTYLNRTPASTTNRRTFTFSAWVKLSKTSDDPFLMGAGSGGQIWFFSDKIRVRLNGSPDYYYDTAAVFRDYSAWYHIVVGVDTTNATSADRVKIYVNGTQQTIGAIFAPPQNFDTEFNLASTVNNIGQWPSGGQRLNGYMTEVNFIDGQALTPSSFGYTNPATGVWSPLAFVGTYGTNGFYLNFSDNSNTTAATLGKDYSGNGNNWTPNNFSVTAGAGNDSLVDSPTSYGTDTGVGGTVRGNYATLNPLVVFGTSTFTNGNLDVSVSSLNTNILATIAIPTSGKWYWEYQITSIGGGGSPMGGIASTSSNSPAIFYRSNGDKLVDGTSSAYGATYTTTDIVGVAVNTDGGTITFYKNGSSQGAVTYATSSGSFFPALRSNAATDTFTVNFGQRAFANTAPSGFQALCTQNLPTPTIGATSTTLATKYFNPVLYTGNATTNAITGVGFQPDFVWMKNRASAYYHGLYDAVRGTGTSKSLYSNTTEAEGTNSANQNLVSFDADGFTLGATSSTNVINTSAQSHVAWNWKANGSGSTNTAGQITSTVSANTTSGFSIVTFTTDGTTKTVGHGLGVKPSLIIAKVRSGVGSWIAMTDIINGSMQYSTLNSTAAFASIGYSAPTSTVFQYNDNNGNTQVAYCFASIEGYSKIGTYTGNGSTDGPFVFTGMRPAYVMFKRTDASSNWYVFDVARNTSNVMSNFLCPNDSLAETSVVGIDFLSNGFKQRGTAADYNASGGTYIYMAFASNPFKYSLAR